MTKMNDSFEVFSNGNLGSVRVIFNEITGEPWFVAKDVCDCLGIKNPSDAISNLLSDEKSSLVLTEGTSPKGGNPTFSIISESGLYTLIMRSRKKEAVDFQRWVTREVLPSIRKHGAYVMGQEEMKPSEREAMLNAIEMVSKKMKVFEEDSNYWFDMYNKILEDATRPLKDIVKDEIPSASFKNGVWTNDQMLVISSEDKYRIVEREQR